MSKISPLLFNLYSEEAIERTLKETSIGIEANREPINNIRYADDRVIIAVNWGIVESNEEKGFTLNIKKTKFMIIAKSQQEKLWIRRKLV